MVSDNCKLTRIAPTPSGFLHIGNALSFAITASIAKLEGADILLRIDDLDRERVRPEFLNDIFETLAQLGIGYSKGPVDPSDLGLNWSQKIRLDRYNSVIEQLAKTGALYSCGCSRKDLGDLSPNSPDHACRLRIEMLENEPLRVRMPEDCVIHFKDEVKGELQIDLNEAMPDFIVRRRDGLPSYQIASLFDDVYYCVNLIVRGEDLLASTAAQLFLAELLGLDEFGRSAFYHHKLITSKEGTKLSKSAGASSLKALRDLSVDTKMVFHELSAFIGMEPKSHDLQSFCTYFDVELLKQP